MTVVENGRKSIGTVDVAAPVLQTTASRMISPAEGGPERE
jgi:uncharacterized protein YacL